MDDGENMVEFGEVNLDRMVLGSLELFRVQRTAKANLPRTLSRAMDHQM